MSKLLEIKSLTVDFETSSGPFSAIDGVDLYINEGETVGVLGESGSGKSTLALAVMGLLELNASVTGYIYWQGENLLLMKKEMAYIRGRDISMIFQDPFSTLNPVLTIGDQIAEVLRYRDKLNYKEAMVEAGLMLSKVHITDPGGRLMDYPHQYSGGMRQRTAIAIATSLEPKLLIADEPTTALDVTVQKKILDLLKEKKRSMLFITHNVSLVKLLCDRVYVMQKGRIVEEGTPFEIINDPKHPYTKELINSYKEINLV